MYFDAWRYQESYQRERNDTLKKLTKDCLMKGLFSELWSGESTRASEIPRL